MSNILTFPRGNPPPGAALRNPSFAYSPALPPHGVAQLEPKPVSRPYRRSGPNMHTFVFRSYDLIVASAEEDLIRDVRCDIGKAQTKLRTIREQLQRDRQHAAAREALLTAAEAKLTAAIAAAKRAPQALEG